MGCLELLGTLWQDHAGHWDTSTHLGESEVWGGARVTQNSSEIPGAHQDTQKLPQYHRILSPVKAPFKCHKIQNLPPSAPPALLVLHKDFKEAQKRDILVQSCKAQPLLCNIPPGSDAESLD